MAKIKFTTKSGKKEELELPEGQILYTALEEKGIELRHGCLAGSCGTCKINILDCNAGLNQPGAIESNTIQSLYEDLENYIPRDQLEKLNLRLACRAKIAGDFSFEQFKKPTKKISEK